MSNKRCAFLSMDDLGSYVNDDALAIQQLRELTWELQTISWRAPDVNWDAFDIVVIRSPWDYMDAPDLFLTVLESINASDARLENSLDIIRWNIDKHYLKDIEQQGIPVVPSQFGSQLTHQRLSEIVASFGSNPFIIKPVISASAKQTFRVTTEHIPVNSIVDAFKDTDYMVQPFMDRIVEEGEYSLFFFSGNFSHCIRKVPKRNDFRVQEEHGGQITAYTPSTHLLESAYRVLECLDQFVLYARVDLVQDEKGDYALMELELIEPSLYLRMDPEAPLRFARAIDAIPF